MKKLFVSKLASSVTETIFFYNFSFLSYVKLKKLYIMGRAVERFFLNNLP